MKRIVIDEACFDLDALFNTDLPRPTSVESETIFDVHGNTFTSMRPSFHTSSGTSTPHEIPGSLDELDRWDATLPAETRMKPD